MSTNDTLPPAPNSIDGIAAAVAGYKQQFDAAQQQLGILDQNYQRQREQYTSGLQMLSGAIAALEQLAKNTEQDAVKRAAEPVPGPSETLPVSEDKAVDADTTTA